MECGAVRKVQGLRWSLAPEGLWWTGAVSSGTLIRFLWPLAACTFQPEFFYSIIFLVSDLDFFPFKIKAYLPAFASRIKSFYIIFCIL